MSTNTHTAASQPSRLGVRPTLASETPPIAAEKPAALKAIAHLFQTLHQRDVRYCHWKSNLRLEQSLQGLTDLDLLVDRKHGSVFRQILHGHNLKPFLAPPGKRYPGVEDYLGFDPASGRLFHLHVHYQLVLGEQLVKNYRLPLEAYFLDSAQRRHGVYVPAAEWELIVLSLRALLKYRDRDAVKDILSIRSPGLPAHILDEIKSLLGQTSLERVAQTLASVAEIVPANVVLEFLKTVAVTPRAGYVLYRLRQRARRALRLYQQRSRRQAVITYFSEMWRQRKAFLRFSPRPGGTLFSGGARLALVGADGAGKSTLCEMLTKWLAWKLDVHAYYLGSKQPSRLSEWLYLGFRVARRSHRTLSGVVGEKSIFSKWLSGLRDTLLYLHHLSIGQDRYRRYLAGQQQALSGSIVIYDRYPLESISQRMDLRLLDGPQIPSIAEVERGFIGRAFARAEQNLYRQIHPPDHLFVLTVSPDISLGRKPDHERATVEAKSRALNELASAAEGNGRKLSLTYLNADLLLEEVTSQLKSKTWEAL